MITADKLKTLTTFTGAALQQAVGKDAKKLTKGQDFKGAWFLGITNGWQFCYSVMFFDKDLGHDTFEKVFLTYDPTADRVIASIG
jgi:hypothetical protein